MGVCVGSPAYMAPEVIEVGYYLQEKAKQEKIEAKKREQMNSKKK